MTDTPTMKEVRLEMARQNYRKMATGLYAALFIGAGLLVATSVTPQNTNEAENLGISNIEMTSASYMSLDDYRTTYREERLDLAEALESSGADTTSLTSDDSTQLYFSMLELSGPDYLRSEIALAEDEMKTLEARLGDDQNTSQLDIAVMEFERARLDYYNALLQAQ